MTESVPGFEATTFAHQGREHDVYRSGSGPAVVVIHEIPGLHPGVTAFGQRLVDAGYRVYLPSLFGRPGAAVSARESIRSITRVCVSREFAILADRTSPVATWLRALPPRLMRNAVGRAWARSGCALPGASPSQWRWSQQSWRRCSASLDCPRP